MTTIRIEEGVRPSARRRNGSIEPGTAPVFSESIYNLRTLGSRTATIGTNDGIYNIRQRSSSIGRRSIDTSHDVEDDDAGLRRPGDYKHKQVFTGKTLAYLTYSCIGVIYGDISTSPLYVYSSTFSAPPTKKDLVGVLSIVLWSLNIMVTLKYVLVILRADNDGEGGTFSTYSLLSRYLNITNRDPREASLVEMKRYKSGDLEAAGRHLRHGFEKSKILKTILKVVGVLAVTMVLSDGVLTPAQSVLGAVQGIKVVSPSISKGTIIGVTDAILVLLFFIQPFGVATLSIAFAPIIVVWLAFNAVFGIYNLVNYDASVFKAFNPGYAFEFLIDHKEQGWRMLGGVLLAFTGVEALFADLGAFSRRAIQLSWLCYILPCLTLAYVGQAAYISEHPDAYDNPFFNAAPPGTEIPALIIALLAAIVASQAIITATFQLLAQVIKLSFFPALKVVHTSKTHHGQLYVPFANWLLMIGTILVASIFNNTTSLGNAYGVCVMFVTFFDTTMVSLAAIFVWRISPYYVFLPWLTIALFDCTYLSSALTKVPQGAWFTLSLATILACVFLLWRFGKESQWAAEAEDRFPTSHFVKQDEDGKMRLTNRYNGTTLSDIKGFGIYFDKAGETTPIVFSQFVIKLTAMPEVMVFFHLRPLETPSVAPEDRHTVSRLRIPNCYRLVVRYGYNDEVISPDLASVIYEQVRLFLSSPRGREEDVDEVDQTGPAPAEPPIAHLRRRSLATFAPETDASTSEPFSSESSDPDSAAKTTSRIASRKDTQSPSGLASVRASTSKGVSHNVEAQSELETLEEAYRHRVLYIVGKEQMKIKSSTGYLRSVLLWAFLWLRDNTRPKVANLSLPIQDLVEVGFVKEI